MTNGYGNHKPETAAQQEKPTAKERSQGQEQAAAPESEKNRDENRGLS